MSLEGKDFLAIGQEWIAAWNSHDLERVLALYDDVVEMTSAVVIALGINPEGRVVGKPQLRAYWSRALEKLPNLKFELFDLFTSPNSMVVRYRNERGAIMCEYLRFNEAGKIVQGSANHLIG